MDAKEHERLSNITLKTLFNMVRNALAFNNIYSGSERGMSVIHQWPFFGSVTREKRKI